jgi:hypothetical protein
LVKGSAGKGEITGNKKVIEPGHAHKRITHFVCGNNNLYI